MQKSSRNDSISWHRKHSKKLAHRKHIATLHILKTHIGDHRISKKAAEELERRFEEKILAVRQPFYIKFWHWLKSIFTTKLWVSTTS